MEKKNIIEEATESVVKGATGAFSGVAKTYASSFTVPLIGGIIAVIAVIAAGLLLYFNPFEWKFSLFGGPEIEKTENVVLEVKKISEFTTACYYEESVLKSEKITEGKTWFGVKTDDVVDAIVLTVKCKVRAGFDLSQLAENDLVIMGDTVNIKLPVPKVFDVISNPSDYKIFEESGEWGHEEIVALQVSGKQKMLENALNSNILEKANAIGKERIVSLFTAMGFNVVNVTLSDVPAREQAPAEPMVAAPAENAEPVPAVEVVPAVVDTVATVEAQPVVDTATVVEVASQVAADE
jgi:hypothetical protein